MGSGGRLLATFAGTNEEPDGEGMAARLYRALDAERDETGIRDIWWYGISVEMELINGEYWAIECVGPDAFHFYPGFVRGTDVTWANIWVAPDLTLDELIERVNEVAAAARRKKNDA